MRYRTWALSIALLSTWPRTGLSQVGETNAATPPPPSQEKSTYTQGLGIAPHVPQLGDEVAPTETPATAPPADGGYNFEFHGYLRAPLRVGLGPKVDGTSGTELHSPPHAPDLSFTDWRYTDNIPGPWTELMFTYGNGRASMSASIAAYNHTIAGYRDLQSQLGINQAFVTLNFPDAFGRYGGLTALVGSFSNRYGGAGKYNAGQYETYIFGRTRAVGETLIASLNLSEDVSITLEHGIGAKLDAVPFGAPNPRPEYLPYPGPVAQGSTFLHHAHAGVTLGKKLTIAGHYLLSFTPDDRSNTNIPPTPSNKGSMTIFGGDVRFSGGVFGEGYAGYSHIDAKDILPLADAIEVLHSLGGSQFKNNYFGRFDPRTGAKPPDDSGSVDTVALQYAFSFGQLARYPAKFRGNGPDLNLTLFGMFNAVQSDNFAHNKLKYGADLIYTPLEFLGIGARYDLVQPDMDDRSQSFSVVSPKLIFKTSFISHERVQLQYSRYFLGSEAYPAFPFSDLPESDPNVFMIQGSMWW